VKALVYTVVLRIRRSYAKGTFRYHCKNTPYLLNLIFSRLKSAQILDALHFAIQKYNL
jgi:hypothetical protein